MSEKRQVNGLKTALTYLAIVGIVLGCGGASQAATTPEQLCQPGTVNGIGFSETLASLAQKAAHDKWEASALQTYGLPYKWADAKDQKEKYDNVKCPLSLNDCTMCTVSARPCKPWSVQKTLAILSYDGRVITAFEDGGIYSSPDGLNLGGGGKTIAVYPGPLKVRAMISYQGPAPAAGLAVVTAFESGGIYSSPNGLNLGGGGKTGAVYPGSLKVTAMISHDKHVITAFENGAIYSSPNGLNLGGGGQTIAVYPGKQKVRAMISHQGLVVLTAFEGGGIYSSPNGLNLGGGGKTTAVYPGPLRVIAMISYGKRVITAFENGSIYSSPAGLNLGGGGSTILVYPAF